MTHLNCSKFFDFAIRFMAFDLILFVYVMPINWSRGMKKYRLFQFWNANSTIHNTKKRRKHQIWKCIYTNALKLSTQQMFYLLFYSVPFSYHRLRFSFNACFFFCRWFFIPSKAHTLLFAILFISNAIYLKVKEVQRTHTHTNYTLCGSIFKRRFNE